MYIKIRCVSGNSILYGKMFSVLEDEWFDSNNCITISRNGYSYRVNKCLFEVVKDCPPTQPSIPTAAKKNTDDDEERCWIAMRPRIDPGYCQCGIHRSDCSFHR